MPASSSAQISGVAPFCGPYAFSKDLLLLMLKQYGLFLDSFQFACKNFKGNAGQTDIAKTIGFESNDEYNEIMFLREITHTINAFNEMGYHSPHGKA